MQRTAGSDLDRNGELRWSGGWPLATCTACERVFFSDDCDDLSNQGCVSIRCELCIDGDRRPFAVAPDKTGILLADECCVCLLQRGNLAVAPCGCAYHPDCFAVYAQLGGCPPAELDCHLHDRPLGKDFVFNCLAQDQRQASASSTSSLDQQAVPTPARSRCIQPQGIELLISESREDQTKLASQCTFPADSLCTSDTREVQVVLHDASANEIVHGQSWCERADAMATSPQTLPVGQHDASANRMVLGQSRIEGEDAMAASPQTPPVGQHTRSANFNMTPAAVEARLDHEARSAALMPRPALLLTPESSKASSSHSQAEESAVAVPGEHVKFWSGCPGKSVVQGPLPDPAQGLVRVHSRCWEAEAVMKMPAATVSVAQGSHSADRHTAPEALQGDLGSSPRLYPLLHSDISKSMSLPHEGKDEEQKATTVPQAVLHAEDWDVPDKPWMHPLPHKAPTKEMMHGRSRSGQGDPMTTLPPENLLAQKFANILGIPTQRSTSQRRQCMEIDCSSSPDRSAGVMPVVPLPLHAQGNNQVHEAAAASSWQEMPIAASADFDKPEVKSGSSEHPLEVFSRSWSLEPRPSVPAQAPCPLVRQSFSSGEVQPPLPRLPASRTRSLSPQARLAVPRSRADLPNGRKLPGEPMPLVPRMQLQSMSKLTVCGLCCELLLPLETRGGACGHLFCVSCLLQYVMMWKHREEQVSCPEVNCGMILSPAMLQRLHGQEPDMHKQLDGASSRSGEWEAGTVPNGEEGHHAEASQSASSSSSACPAQPSEPSSSSSSAGLVQQDKAPQPVMQFNCPICFDEHPAGSGTELHCGHHFCKGCFLGYLDSKIKEAQVADEELVCPMPGCGRQVAVTQVEDATGGTALWEKFLQFRMNMWQPEGDEVMVDCPIPGCEARFLATHDMPCVECPECRIEFCLKCRKGRHDGMHCDDFAGVLRSSTDADHSFEKLMADEQWKRCPVCGVPSERVSGCNFMKCESAECRRGGHCTFWCYVCAQQIREDEHYSHYPSGPFEDECEGRPAPPSPLSSPPSPPTPPPPPARLARTPPQQPLPQRRLASPQMQLAERLPECRTHGVLCRRGAGCPGRAVGHGMRF